MLAILAIFMQTILWALVIIGAATALAGAAYALLYACSGRDTSLLSGTRAQLIKR